MIKSLMQSGFLLQGCLYCFDGFPAVADIQLSVKVEDRSPEERIVTQQQVPEIGVGQILFPEFLFLIDDCPLIDQCFIASRTGCK